MTVSCFAPATLPMLPSLEGIELCVGQSGLRYQGRDDFVHFRLQSPTPVIAGVFTQNTLPGEPVKWCRQRLPHPPSSIIIAAGNANVFTGTQGWHCLEQVADAVTQKFATPASSTYIAMTGVIGEVPNAQALCDAIAKYTPQTLTSAAWHKAAQAIMTTDTFAKLASVQGLIGATPFTLCGIAKGSGMVAPNMATMLGFLFTDLALSQTLLQRALEQAVDHSFNAISIDSDTSTSDSVLLVSTATAPLAPITDADSTEFAQFVVYLQQLCHDLALQVVSDGEGITKRLDITVTQATSTAQAKEAGMAIANSPLVKTAIHGQDANWGRIVMALGKSGVALDPGQLSISVGGCTLAHQGSAIAYDQAAMDAHLRGQVIDIHVSLGVGEAQAQVWGNDLSAEYIRINADYRS